MDAIELKNALTSLVDAKIATFIWGAPGVGKSSIVKQIAKEKNINFIDLRLSLMDPTDLKGIPFYDKETHTALWAPPEFLPRDGKGILFLDELNSAPPSVQASAYQLILDRKVGEYSLPDGYSIIAAGNRESDRGVVYKMSSPLANRFVHLELDVSFDAFKAWAYKNNLDDKIISFLSYKKDYLFSFDPKKLDKSFATPRSWEAVDKILKSSLDESLQLKVISGTIGDNIAVSFLSFCKIINSIPSVQKIIEDDNPEFSDDIKVNYALVSILVSSYTSDHNSLENILKYALKMQEEFSVLLVQDLLSVNAPLEKLELYKKWVSKFSYLLE